MTEGRHPLLEYLVADAVCLQLETTTSEEVIRLLADRLYQAGCVKAGFADAVVARERSMPTGLPLGHRVNVAIPHADPVHVVKPAVGLATLKEPVTFANMEDADDEIRVGVVFLLALNDKDRQIDMLQSIVATTQEADLLARLHGASSVDAVHQILRNPAEKA